MRSQYGIPFRSLEGIARLFSRITIRGDYLGSKWHRKKIGWTKLHAVISINDVSVISFAITDEHVHDARAGRKLLVGCRYKKQNISDIR